jgi:hypothetical protein
MPDCNVQMVLIAVPICNISAFFIHKIQIFPIQPGIFDIFQSHCVQLSTFILNTLYTWFCTSYIGITYKYLYKWSLYSEIPITTTHTGANGAVVLEAELLHGCAGHLAFNSLWLHFCFLPHFALLGVFLHGHKPGKFIWSLP